MKKIRKRLTLNKVKISRIINTSQIIGGTGSNCNNEDPQHITVPSNAPTYILSCIVTHCNTQTTLTAGETTDNTPHNNTTNLNPSN